MFDISYYNVNRIGDMIFFFRFIFCMNVLPACVHIQHGASGPQISEESVGSPGPGLKGGCELPIVDRG